MADGRPYTDLPIRKMAGCYGPPNKDVTAIAAYTPNVPWAKFGCPDRSTSMAAVPRPRRRKLPRRPRLWMQKNKAALEADGEDWMRVEATRKALFESAQKADAHQRGHVGRGLLHANAALDLAPAAEAALRNRRRRPFASFPLLKVLTGLGMAASAEKRRMFELKRCRSASNRTRSNGS